MRSKPNQFFHIQYICFSIVNKKFCRLKNINLKLANSSLPSYKIVSTYRDVNGNSYERTFNNNGIINYGDGTAKANASFLNGLVIGQGQYLNTRGQPSSYSLLQNEDYNNFTYQITVNKEIEKYRSVLMNLLHPAGTNVIGRMVDRVPMEFDTDLQEAAYFGRPFYSANGGILYGNMQISGNITTTNSNTYTLGTLSDPFQSVYVGPTALFVDGIEISNTSGQLTISNVPSVNVVGNLISTGTISGTFDGGLF